MSDQRGRVPDRPHPEEIGSLTKAPLWVRIESRAQTGSTNDDCRALALAGAPEGTVVVAARQTQGRGRLGRVWESPEGGVYLTALLRPTLAAADLVALPVVVSLGVAHGLESLGVDTLLKWPNDVWLGRGKVAGVLLEMQAEADQVAWVCAGVGVNVARGQEAVPPAAYVTDEAPFARASEVAAAVLDGIAGAYARFCAEGFGTVREECERRSLLAGRDVVVRGGTGEVVAAGRVEGLDDLGRLVVATPDGRRAVAAGDVTLRDVRASADRPAGHAPGGDA